MSFEKDGVRVMVPPPGQGRCQPPTGSPAPHTGLFTDTCPQALSSGPGGERERTAGTARPVGGLPSGSGGGRRFRRRAPPSWRAGPTSRHFPALPSTRERGKASYAHLDPGGQRVPRLRGGKDGGAWHPGGLGARVPTDPAPSRTRSPEAALHDLRYLHALLAP